MYFCDFSIYTKKLKILPPEYSKRGPYLPFLGVRNVSFWDVKAERQDWLTGQICLYNPCWFLTTPAVHWCNWAKVIGAICPYVCDLCLCDMSLFWAVLIGHMISQEALPLRRIPIPPSSFTPLGCFTNNNSSVGLWTWWHRLAALVYN
jgi:hypothetical protein